MQLCFGRYLNCLWITLESYSKFFSNKICFYTYRKAARIVQSVHWCVSPRLTNCYHFTTLALFIYLFFFWTHLREMPLYSQMLLNVFPKNKELCHITPIKSIIEKLTLWIILSNLETLFIFCILSHNLGIQFWQNVTEVMLSSSHCTTSGDSHFPSDYVKFNILLTVVSLCFSTANLLSNPLQLIYIYIHICMYKIGK